MLSTRGITSPAGPLNLLWAGLTALVHILLVVVYRPGALQSPKPGYSPVADYAHLFVATLDLVTVAIVAGFVLLVGGGRLYYGRRDTA